MISFQELIQGPLYLCSLVLICLPFAYCSWRQEPHREMAFHWISALLFAGIAVSLSLYSLALLRMVDSPVFLFFPLVAPASLLVAWLTGHARSLPAFLASSRAAFLDSGIAGPACALFSLALSVFSIRFYPHFYDSWNYHMTIASLAVSQGGLPLSFEHPYVPSSPPFLELWKTWLWLASGKPGLLEAAQLPFAAGLAAIAYSTSREIFKSRRRLAALCSLFVLFSPKLIESSVSSYLDVYIGFFLASSVYFLVRRRYFHGALAALAAMSFKYSAIGSGALPLALCLGLLIRGRAWKPLFVLGALAPLFLSWYGVNLYRYGNPLYPYVFADAWFAPGFLRALLPKMFSCQTASPCWDGFYIEKIQDLRVLSGFGPRSLVTQWLSWLDISCLDYEPYLSRFGPAFGAIAVPGLVCSTLRYGGNARHLWNRQPRPQLALFLVVVLSLVFTVKPQESRIALFAVPFLFAFGIFWLGIFLRVARRRALLRSAGTITAAVALLWSAAHGISRQERFLEFWSQGFADGNGSKAILLSMPHPRAGLLYELAREAQQKCSGSPLLFDFHFGMQHQYGFAPAASFAFIRRDWRLKTESLPTEEMGRILGAEGLEDGHCLVTFLDSPISASFSQGAGKNWIALKLNALGGVYQLKKN